ncbi:MAG: hypothetical protein QXT45_06870 [Candidatus Bilamarchaeaceae archaeon]
MENVLKITSTGQRTFQSISLIASANLFATVLGVVGSLVQAHFIAPDDLGFIRKYSVVANYAIFLNLGLFAILEREYPVLIGRGEKAQAQHTAAIVQSWVLSSSGIVCGILSVVMLIAVLQGNWREAAAWFIQIVAVFSTLYVGYLTCLFRSGHEFQKLATGQFTSSIAMTAVLPLFIWLPFPALVLRSVVGQIISALYLHLVRPVKLGWCWFWRDWLNLVKRGMRLYVGLYLRYSFWLTVEIWLMLYLAGNEGVGLLVFSKMIVDAASQVSYAINQVYLPRLAQRFGETNRVRACLKLALKPSLVNLGVSGLVTLSVWLVMPPILQWAFPKYVQAIPLVRILALQLFIVSFSLPLFMVGVLDGYFIQISAAILGLIVFLGVAFLLHRAGLGMNAVAWGTLAGQMTFAATCLSWLYTRAWREARE